MRIILIGIGGFAGSILRYLLSGWVQAAAPRSAFPVGTLAVNVLGCFSLGVLSELADARGLLAPETRALLIIGLLGGFTTFSAFANETMNALRAGDRSIAIANVFLSVTASLVAVWLGRTAAHAIWR